MIKGVWFRTPGTADLCVYWFGDDDAIDCQFAPATSRDVRADEHAAHAGARIAADHDCRPVTVALTREDGSVLFRRAGVLRLIRGRSRARRPTTWAPWPDRAGVGSSTSARWRNTSA